jgi:hypothetical protein
MSSSVVQVLALGPFIVFSDKTDGDLFVVSEVMNTADVRQTRVTLQTLVLSTNGSVQLGYQLSNDKLNGYNDAATAELDKATLLGSALTTVTTVYGTTFSSIPAELERREAVHPVRGVVQDHVEWAGDGPGGGSRRDEGVVVIGGPLGSGARPTAPGVGTIGSGGVRTGPSAGVLASGARVDAGDALVAHAPPGDPFDGWEGLRPSVCAGCDWLRGPATAAATAACQSPIGGGSSGLESVLVFQDGNQCCYRFKCVGLPATQPVCVRC